MYIHIIYIYIHTHNGVLLRHKKNEIMLFSIKYLDLEINILME